MFLSMSLGAFAEQKITKIKIQTYEIEEKSKEENVGYCHYSQDLRSGPCNGNKESRNWPCPDRRTSRTCATCRQERQARPCFWVFALRGHSPAWQRGLEGKAGQRHYESNQGTRERCHHQPGNSGWRPREGQDG